MVLTMSESKTVIPKNPAVVYFPVSKNPFEFKAGLYNLGGKENPAENRVFQIDDQWSYYRSEKIKSRQERLAKYICQQNLSQHVAAQACHYIASQFTQEYPNYFHYQQGKQFSKFNSLLSNERFVFDSQMNLLAESETSIAPDYLNMLDALACQLQEDITITEVGKDNDKLTYLHLCYPNYWAAGEKIGTSFLDSHTPVPDMEKIARNHRGIVEMLLNKGPFERFTWGLTSDTRLNHHPEPAPGFDKQSWWGRKFDSSDPKLFFRIERQITIPLPEVNSFLFIIRTYYRDIALFSHQELTRLMFSINSMSDNILNYKGISQSKKEILEWMSALKDKAAKYSDE